MSSHFNAVGFPVRDMDGYWALARKAAASGVHNRAPDGTTLVRWTADGGPEIWSHLDRNGEVVGAMPFFTTGTAYRLAVTGTGEDPDQEMEGWVDGWVEPSEEDEPYSGAFPLRISLVNYALARHRLTTFPSIYQIEFVALAHEADLFRDDKAYRDAPGDVYRVPLGSIVSAAHFGVDVDAEAFSEATATLSAPIDSAQLLTNPATAEPYWRVEVTVQGVRLHTSVDQETLGGEPAAGQIVAGSYWMVGRLL